MVYESDEVDGVGGLVDFVWGGKYGWIVLCCGENFGVVWVLWCCWGEIYC